MKYQWQCTIQCHKTCLPNFKWAVLSQIVIPIRIDIKHYAITVRCMYPLKRLLVFRWLFFVLIWIKINMENTLTNSILVSQILYSLGIYDTAFWFYSVAIKRCINSMQVKPTFVLKMSCICTYFISKEN